jgi:hypothetical protein
MKDFIPCMVLAVLYLFFYHVLALEAREIPTNFLHRQVVKNIDIKVSRSSFLSFFLSGRASLLEHVTKFISLHFHAIFLFFFHNRKFFLTDLLPCTCA